MCEMGTEMPSLTTGRSKAKKPTGGVRSLADVARDAEDDSDDDDEGNEYYAGGHKRYIDYCKLLRLVHHLL